MLEYPQENEGNQNSLLNDDSKSQVSYRTVGTVPDDDLIRLTKEEADKGCNQCKDGPNIDEVLEAAERVRKETYGKDCKHRGDSGHDQIQNKDHPCTGESLRFVFVNEFRHRGNIESSTKL